ncbi:Ger(x)C family spore germination protein [Paucisalibacillus globulus]|uniref:Ger(x)C family spore germination protein n=1 Tax=Paucisalibacillus globulus TaxID=351095 RepID=UPI000BB7B043|nr:Ger(x)C family spore germination protein [Paucisalibacillus globulus]
MIKRINKALSCFIALMLLSGCWDSVNIEERGFIVGMAIDVAEEGKSDGNYQLILTNQFAVPSGLGTPSQSGGGGGKSFMNLSASGTSIYDIAQNLANQTNKMPFFEHLKLIIVSEEVLAIPELFANVLDVFIRNRDTRRGIKVIVSKGKAMDILNVQPDTEKLPARYIDRILENSMRKTGEMKPVRIGDIHEYLLSKSSFVLSEVTADDKKITFEGGAVYKGVSKSIIGNLDLEEMLGFELITGQEVQGPVVINYKEHLTAYSIMKSKSKITIDADRPDNIDINVTIQMEGEIQETFGTVILEDPKVIQELEEEISEKVKAITNQVIDKAQKELEADIFGFADKLEKFHYDTWKKVKKDWERGENYFSESNVKVTVKAEVRTDGVVDKSKE